MASDPNNARPTRLDSIDGPVELKGRAIGVSLPCPTCGYDLRGGPAVGACSECGTDIRQVLAQAIDPTAHRLPVLADPLAVGNGLCLGAASLAIGIVLPLVGAVFTIFEPLSLTKVQAKSISEQLVLVAAVGALILGGWACWCLRPHHGGPLQQAARRAILLLGMGTLVLGGGLIMMLVSRDAWIAEIAAVEAMGVGLVLGLIGMRRVLVEAGQRCRLFRTSTIDRQRIAPLVLVSVMAMVLLGVWVVAIALHADTAALVLAALWAVVATMLALGLAYLLLNAWWIRRDLRSPPPKLLDLLQAEGDQSH